MFTWSVFIIAIIRIVYKYAYAWSFALISRCVLASLYEGLSVRRSVRRSVGPSVTHFFEYAKTRVLDFGRWIGVGNGERRVRGGYIHTQTHAGTRIFATKTSNGARAAVPRDASYVWRDQTCYRSDGWMEERGHNQVENKSKRRRACRKKRRNGGGEEEEE